MPEDGPADLGLALLLLTPQQAADLCQVSLDRIYAWTYEPGFPVIATPHQLRIHARLFDEWLVKRAAIGRSREEKEEAAA